MRSTSSILGLIQDVLQAIIIMKVLLMKTEDTV